MVGKSGHSALLKAVYQLVAGDAADAELLAERAFAVFLAESGFDEHFSLLHDVRLFPGHRYLRAGDTGMMDVNEVFRLFCKGGLWVVPTSRAATKENPPPLHSGAFTCKRQTRS
ncbi:MAG: hypothetical protein ACFN9G_10755 [Cardiobacterium sp.]